MGAYRQTRGSRLTLPSSDSSLPLVVKRTHYAACSTFVSHTAWDSFNTRFLPPSPLPPSSLPLPLPPSLPTSPPTCTKVTGFWKSYNWSCFFRNPGKLWMEEVQCREKGVDEGGVIWVYGDLVCHPSPDCWEIL